MEAPELFEKRTGVKYQNWIQAWMITKRLEKNEMNIKKILVDFILNVFGYAYIWIEQFKEYPDDSTILGMKIDDELYNMNRQQLCRYMDAVLPEKGFFNLQSTSKIRLGCQLLRNYHQLKEKKNE